MQNALSWEPDMPPLVQKPFLTQDIHLAKVTSVNDPDGLNRVEIKLLSHSGSPQQDGTLWARVAVPCAGNNKGARED